LGELSIYLKTIIENLVCIENIKIPIRNITKIHDILIITENTLNIESSYQGTIFITPFGVLLPLKCLWVVVIKSILFFKPLQS
jgi:hypothetical protein